MSDSHPGGLLATAAAAWSLLSSGCHAHSPNALTNAAQHRGERRQYDSRCAYWHYQQLGLPLRPPSPCRVLQLRAVR